MIAREQQFAEKVHAYSLPRNQPNSRVKDLADMALLIGDTPLNLDRLLEVIAAYVRAAEDASFAESSGSAAVAMGGSI